MMLRIATRRSALALWQAEFVAAELRAAHPHLSVNLVPMTTRGDQLLDRPLAEIGGKGLFLKELEQAMAEGRADIAVHSMKDVPNELPDGFVIAAVLERHDPRDALVGPFASVEALPEAAHVGTSSLRRQSQLLHHRPDLQISSLRGNVNTRLARLDSGDFDAIVLAAAGLDRLQMTDRIATRLDPLVCLPAVAQGAIAIECLAGAAQIESLLQALHDPVTGTCVTAERAFSAALAGSCQVPLAAHALIDDGGLRLDAMVASIDGKSLLRQHLAGSGEQPVALGESLAGKLLEQGAGAILDALP